MDLAAWLLCVLLVVALVALCVIIHAGFFSDVRIRTSAPASLPHRVAYTVHDGDYRNVGTPLSDLSTKAPKQTQFCLFYDDPEKVVQEKLRSIVGCCLPDSAESSLEQSLKYSGYLVWTFPKCSKAVITEFPNRSFISCIIAPRIVYPALKKYFMEFDLKSVGPIVEVYHNGYIQYIAPMENNDGFFVPQIVYQRKKDQ